MNLQQAIEIIKNVIEGVNCNGPQRRTLEQAFAIITSAAIEEPKEKKGEPE